MAEINYYKTYSVLSTTSNKDNAVVETILAKLNELKKTNSIKVAKKILKDSFGITKNNGVTYIEGGYPVKLYEDNTVFSVNLVIKDKHVSYYYKKGGKDVHS